MNADPSSRSEIDEASEWIDQFPPENVQFPPENVARRLVTTNRWSGRWRTRRTVVVAAVCVIGLAAPTALWFRSTASGAETSKGFLNVESDPEGATVLVDGHSSGTTPVSLTLKPGIHRLQVKRGERSQEVSITIAQNVSVVHHFAWPAEPLNTTATGSLRIISDGGAGEVTVDRVARGPTPLNVGGLSVGDHEVVVVRDGTSYRRTMRVEPGATASLVVGTRTTGSPESGWLSASAAVPLQILEDGKLVGSTESERLLIPAGDHTFEFADPALGFRTSRNVKVVAGRTQSVAIELPQAPISINATPWAQVWLDGRALGDTPIGNLTTTIGSHEVVLRHPQLGERRVTALVTMKEPARVGVDMRKSP